MSEKGEKAQAAQAVPVKTKKKPVRREGDRETVALFRGEGETSERLSLSIGPDEGGKYALRVRQHSGDVDKLASETFPSFGEAQTRRDGLLKAAREKGWMPKTALRPEDLL